MEGVPVVTAKQMKAVEEAAFKAGESDEAYMENAGAGIAAAVEEHLITPRSGDTISLLIGKGNNGGDAFVAGELLREKGFSVIAYHLYPLEECSPLSQKMGKRFRANGGKLVHLQTLPSFEKGVILDGLFGTGFSGKVEGLAKEVIEAANASDCDLFAIDIPSGLSGDTGEVGSVAIRAHTTLYLGLPKIGFFQKDGWNHVGTLQRVDFGMPREFFRGLDPIAHLISEKEAAKHLPPIERSRHKYSAGYVLAVAGSPSMPGAAMMACLAALKTGAGIVRLFHPPGMQEALSTSPYELIREEWDLQDTTRLKEEAKRAKALILGPGMGRTDAARGAVHALLAELTLPTVLDADALYFLAEDPTLPLTQETLLTPHHGEMERILGEPPTLENCQAYVNKTGVTLVLKGAPTLIFHSGHKPLIIARGDPAMATAGTGDVLTGLLAAMLAQQLLPQGAAALAALLHAISGELAAKAETQYGVIATDLIHHLPEAIETLIHLGRTP